MTNNTCQDIILYTKPVSLCCVLICRNTQLYECIVSGEQLNLLHLTRLIHVCDFGKRQSKVQAQVASVIKHGTAKHMDTRGLKGKKKILFIKGYYWIQLSPSYMRTSHCSNLLKNIDLLNNSRLVFSTQVVNRLAPRALSIAFWIMLPFSYLCVQRDHWSYMMLKDAWITSSYWLCNNSAIISAKKW